jgi:hypothetical protein
MAYPTLIDIYSRMEPYYTAASQAQRIYLCGIRSASWAGEIGATVEILSYDVMETLSPQERRELMQMRDELTIRLELANLNCLSYSRSLLPSVLDQVRQLFNEHHHDEFGDLRRLQSIFREVA